MTNWLRKNWLALALIATLLFSVYFAHAEAQQNERGSIQRAEDTCRRTNPMRAYLLLRAREVKSATADVAPLALAIINCKASVLHGGQPIPLSPPIQAEYLRLFAAREVPITRGDKIVGKVPFDVYFAGKGPARP